MASFGERIRLLRGNRSQKEFAEEINVTRSALSLWEQNRRHPPHETVVQIAKTLGVSASYLEGDTDNPIPFDERAEAIIKDQGIELVPIPIVGRIHAGDPIPAYEHIEGWIAIPKSQSKGGTFFALRVEGDCMAPAKIDDGDLVIVRQQPEVEDGEIAVVMWPDVSEAQLRRMYREDSMVILKADNPTWKPELVRKRQLTVVGRVVGVQTTPAAAEERVNG